MTVDAHDGSALIVIVAFVVGSSFGMMFGILGTLCMTHCFRKKDVPIIPEPTVIERIPEPTIIERIVEVEKPVPMPAVPQGIWVGLTKDTYAFHDKRNMKCSKIEDLVSGASQSNDSRPARYASRQKRS